MDMRIDPVILVALGGNLPTEIGPPEAAIRAAIAEFSNENMHVERVSRLYDTPCFPPGAGPDYVNAAAVLRCDISSQETTPQAVLERLHRIEVAHGRTGSSGGGGARSTST